MNLEYPWLSQFKGYTIEDNEEFVFIKHNGIPINVYNARAVTEEILKKDIKRRSLEERTNGIGI